MGFDFNHTCPRIDKAIATAKSHFEDTLNEIILEANPLFAEQGGSKYFEWLKKQSEVLYQDFEECFESVRETNEEMRKEAEHQIAALESDIADLKYELREIDQLN